MVMWRTPVSRCPVLLTSPDPIASLRVSGVALVKGHWYYLDNSGFGSANRKVMTREYPSMASPTVIYNHSTGGTNPTVASLASDGSIVVWVEFDAALQSQFYVLKGLLVDHPTTTYTLAHFNVWSALGITYHPTTGLFYWVQRVDHGSSNYQDTIYTFTPSTTGTFATSLTAVWQSSIGPIGDGTHIDVSEQNVMVITPDSIFGMSEPLTGHGEWGAWRFDVGTETMYFDGTHENPVQPGGLIGTPNNTLVFNSDVIDGNTQVQEFYTGLSSTTWGYRVWSCTSVVDDFIGSGWEAIEGNFDRYTISNGTDVFEWPGGHDAARPANDLFANAIDLGTASSGTSSLISNRLAETEASEPIPTDGPGTGPYLSLWWKWTCPGGFVGSISFDTFGSTSPNAYGSNLDTVLAAYTGITLAGLTEVTSNDDHAGGSSGFMSQITFTPTPGTVYWLQVSTYTAAQVSGIRLSWA